MELASYRPCVMYIGSATVLGWGGGGGGVVPVDLVALTQSSEKDMVRIACTIDLQLKR
jgi:hypothetical protein